jgi:hypothetical protein
MVGVESARHEAGLLKAARLEATMETFLWLAG